MKISFVIPTFNSSKFIYSCLNSIKKNVTIEYEIIIIDAGSKDGTIEIIRKFDKKIKIINNSYQTGEAGKLIGIQNVRYDYVCLLDSDNELEKNFIEISLKTLSKDKRIIGAEPIKFSYRKGDGIIDRFCSIYGVNDPLNLYLGNFDKYSEIYKDWTKTKYQKDFEDDEKIIVKFKKNNHLPTIGANGSIFYKSDLIRFIHKKRYFFDVDFIKFKMKKENEIYFTKVKKGIYHNYCGSDFFVFIKKQIRRVQDFLYFKDIRVSYLKISKLKVIYFIFDTLFPILMIAKSIKISFKYKDPAPLVMYPLSVITLYIYSYKTLTYLFFGKYRFKRN